MSASEHRDRRMAPNGRSSNADAPGWWVYRGTGRPLRDFALADELPAPPMWRQFNGGPLPVNDTPPPDDGEATRRLGPAYHLSEQDIDPHEVDMVNAALYLRRPLLVTGHPGTGKSALAFKIARELNLGRVLRWAITSHTTQTQGLYSYDAIGRVQAATAAGYAAGMQATARLKFRGAKADPASDPAGQFVEPPVGEFVRLGPLGTALLPTRTPRVLLIDELDKSEVDLPNDLLGVFEDGQFTIQELERVRNRSPEVTVFTDDPQGTTTIIGGRVMCHAFPVIIITSNGEREFPPAFLRRCLQLQMRPPDAEQLAKMVANHLLDERGEHRLRLVQEFVDRSAATGSLPADKLMEAVYLATSGAYRKDDPAWPRLMDALWRSLVP
jgi:MoxR-like ATPase